MTQAVTVIIPTTCESRRKTELLCAIGSIQRQQGVTAKVLVVVNGDRFDPELFQQLRDRQDIQTEYLSVGNLPKALEYGRSRVETEFFAFLDDDDELLENSLITRLRVLQENPDVDLAVTNGYNVSSERREIRVKGGATVNANPLLALVRENWLASCGGLFRTRTIGQDYFKDIMKYYEWTLLAFRITRERKIHFVNEPTFIINDSPGSLSKKPEFVYADETIITTMLSHPVSDEIQRELSIKMAHSLHAISCFERSNGRFISAWRYHLRSLKYTGGMTYLLYTRKLLVPGSHR